MYSKYIKDYIKFICASLPYGLKCKCPYISKREKFTIVDVDMEKYPEHVNVRLKKKDGTYINSRVEDTKLLLRPFSSIGKSESEELSKSSNMDEWFLIRHIDTKGYIDSLFGEEANDNDYDSTRPIFMY